MSEPTEASMRTLNEAIPQTVRDQLTSHDRLCPVIAGQAVARLQEAEGHLVVRSPKADVEITAPSDLIKTVLSVCDGTRTLTEIDAQAPADRREELAEFIEFLLERGALIDASLYCAHALAYGYQFSPFGLAAPGDLTVQISRRFQGRTKDDPVMQPERPEHVAEAPLDRFFDARGSVYTFDDRSPTAEALHALLWSAAGIVRMQHPRVGLQFPQRTLASAGAMHLLQVHVALRRQVGTYPPGVYRVTYPGERLVRLVPVHDDLSLLPVAFNKPWELRYATGALFVTADPSIGALRYRNRSLQYLFMEAGALLHNVALTAPALGLAQATIGGYYETPARHLCGVGDGALVLGTSVFGVEPTHEQRRLAQTAPDLDFAWVNGDSPRFAMPFFMARARIRQDDPSAPYTWGRDVDPWMAERKAVAEAVEREGYREPRELVRASLHELGNAVDPRNIVRYAPAQFEEPGFPFVPFDPDKAYAWVRATCLSDGADTHVLAQLVYARASLKSLPGTPEPNVAQSTSSGCAASVSWPDAVHRATGELIERDAFMRHWLAQHPGTVLDPAAWPTSLQRRAQAMTATGCQVVIQQLDSRWLPVAMVSVQHQSEHFTTLGLAAHEDFSAAADAAMDEVEARVYAWLHGHRSSITRADQVSTTEHHFELYGLPQFFTQADAVLFPRLQTTAGWPVSPRTEGFDALVHRMNVAGIRLYVVDITPRAHAIDQGRTPLHVARVLATGLVPISFGHRLEPLGLVTEWHPKARHPHPFP